MQTDSIDSPETTMASPSTIDQWVKTANRLLILFVVMVCACGFGLYQTGQLDLHMPSAGQTEPPKLDRGGKIGPLDSSIDELRKKNWWWMKWLD